MLVDSRKMTSVRYHKEFDGEGNTGALARKNDRFWWFIS